MLIPKTMSPKKTILSFFILSFFFLPLDAQATDKLYLGSFNDDKFQIIYQKPYFLYNVDRDKSHPIYLENITQLKNSLIKDSNYFSEIENIFYCPETIRSLNSCELAESFSKAVHWRISGKVFLDQEKLTSFLEDLAKTINHSPQDGKLGISNEGTLMVIKPSQKGYRLNIKKSLEVIIKHLTTSPDKQSIPLITEETSPKISTDNLEQYGIQEKIGEGVSNFAGSPKNRVHNIKVAVEQFHGLLIAPGEEFSFTKNLGEVDGEHGYKEELVIKKDKTVPEFGGGICQVSTTMFRAALNSGVKITERHNHAYPVSYYNPQGTDATVYIPKPDLRFVNDTPAYILIQGKIKDNYLYFYFYGTSDGRQVELVGPKVTERTPDGKMRTILYRIIKDKNNNVIRKDVFKSFYDNPANYPHPEDIFLEKPKDWSNKQWKEYVNKYGAVIEDLKKKQR